MVLSNANVLKLEIPMQRSHISQVSRWHEALVKAPTTGASVRTASQLREAYRWMFPNHESSINTQCISGMR
jgi:hypothetical protein